MCLGLLPFFSVSSLWLFYSFLLLTFIYLFLCFFPLLFSCFLPHKTDPYLVSESSCPWKAWTSNKHNTTWNGDIICAENDERNHFEHYKISGWQQHCWWHFYTTLSSILWWFIVRFNYKPWSFTSINLTISEVKLLSLSLLFNIVFTFLRFRNSSSSVISIFVRKKIEIFLTFSSGMFNKSLIINFLIKD